MTTLKWLNPDVASLVPYEPGKPIEDVAREFGLDPAAICKLASNENPLGTSPKAMRAMRDALRETHLYPDGGAYYLREKLAATHGVEREQIVLGAGSNEILEFIGHCFMAPGRSIVVSQYAFVIYKLIAKSFSTRVIEVPARDFGHNLPAMRRAIDAGTSVLFISNPNNPTGTLLRQAAIQRFMDRVPDDVLIVFDEAYAEIALGRMPDTLSFARERPNCLVLRTFSKAYGLAGARVGYGVGAKPLVQALQKARQPFNVCRHAQAGALAALDDAGFVRRSRKLFRAGKAYIENAFADMGLEYVPSFANFMLVRVGNGEAVARELMRRGVIVRPVSGYGLPEHIRVSFGTMPENEAFVAALRQVLGR